MTKSEFKNLKNAKVIVCVGSGGVGKTTLSAALAYSLARTGKKVLVLTVDPSKRLKTTLGLPDSGDLVRISDDDLKGELYAAVIDAKKTFDDFIFRASKNKETVAKILNNKLYIQLSTTLSGSQEFTALEKLYNSYESQKFDIIVLDTPPTKHAIDFLNAPQKLSALFNEGVSKWFRDPEGKKQGLFLSIVQTGTRKVLKVLETLTGSAFMKELADFFIHIEDWQDKLEKRVIDVHRLLVHADTHFCLVTSFDEAKMKEAEFFGKEIRKGGYHLSCMFMNRAYPMWYPQTKQSSDLNLGSLNPLKDLYLGWVHYYDEREKIFSTFAERMRANCDVLKIPELESDISSIAGVKELSQLIDKGVVS